MTDESRGRILIVEDDPQVRELFASYLDDRYAVETAASGKEALSKMSDDVDVVLLDRVMPGLSGGEVLNQIRAEEFECRVAMVTAVAPDLDVIEMGFDDYLVKPVSRSELVNVVDSLLHWEAYDAVLKQYFNTSRKVAVLEEELPREALDDSDEYQGLLAALDSLRIEADEAMESLDTADFERVVAGVSDASGGDSSIAEGS